MPPRKKPHLADLTTADLKRMLASRKRIDVLEVERDKLAGLLSRVEKELAKLMGGGLPSAPGRKKARKKTTKKKATKKKATKKKATKKKATKKKATKKKTTKKKATKKKATKKKTSRVAAKKGTGRVKLEDVVLAVISKNRGPISFKDLSGTITKKKLFKTKSKDFDNVLRRTLSTSKAVKRVGRGVYDAA